MLEAKSDGFLPWPVYPDGSNLEAAESFAA